MYAYEDRKTKREVWEHIENMEDNRVDKRAKINMVNALVVLWVFVFKEFIENFFVLVMVEILEGL